MFISDRNLYIARDGETLVVPLRCVDGRGIECVAVRMRKFGIGQVTKNALRVPSSEVPASFTHMKSHSRARMLASSTDPFLNGSVRP
jgi:hypothetical protein